MERALSTRSKPRRKMPGVATPTSDPLRDALDGPGQELPHRDQLEDALGADLGDVRAFVGQEQLAGIDAAAAASGATVAFRDPAPSREQVAHEAIHVVQGRAGLSDRVLSEPGDAAEAEADALAGPASRGEPVDVQGPATAQVSRDYEEFEDTTPWEGAGEVVDAYTDAAGTWAGAVDIHDTDATHQDWANDPAEGAGLAVGGGLGLRAAWKKRAHAKKARKKPGVSDEDAHAAKVEQRTAEAEGAEAALTTGQGISKFVGGFQGESAAETTGRVSDGLGGGAGVFGLGLGAYDLVDNWSDKSARERADAMVSMVGGASDVVNSGIKAATASADVVASTITAGAGVASGTINLVGGAKEGWDARKAKKATRGSAMDLHDDRSAKGRALATTLGSEQSAYDAAAADLTSKETAKTAAVDRLAAHDARITKAKATEAAAIKAYDKAGGDAAIVRHQKGRTEADAMRKAESDTRSGAYKHLVGMHERALTSLRIAREEVETARQAREALETARAALEQAVTDAEAARKAAATRKTAASTSRDDAEAAKARFDRGSADSERIERGLQAVSKLSGLAQEEAMLDAVGGGLDIVSGALVLSGCAAPVAITAVALKGLLSIGRFGVGIARERAVKTLAADVGSAAGADFGVIEGKALSTYRGALKGGKSAFTKLKKSVYDFGLDEKAERVPTDRVKKVRAGDRVSDDDVKNQWIVGSGWAERPKTWSRAGLRKRFRAAARKSGTAKTATQGQLIDAVYTIGDHCYDASGPKFMSAKVESYDGDSAPAAADELLKRVGITPGDWAEALKDGPVGVRKMIKKKVGSI